jgi:hypothetical protein
MTTTPIIDSDERSALGLRTSSFSRETTDAALEHGSRTTMLCEILADWGTV